MANILQQLPIQFIITTLQLNPDALSFPWNGQDIPRQALINEVSVRPLPATTDSLRAGVPVGTEPVVTASRKKK